MEAPMGRGPAGGAQTMEAPMARGPSPANSGIQPQVAMMRKGGQVKKMAKGGHVKANGCAQRGKTRGRMV
jgi:hypothetical protein